MKYMGSKRRIADDLLTIILAGRKPYQWYVEPFVGGGNMIERVHGNRLGGDIDEYAVEALKLIRDNVDPIPRSEEDITEEDYKAMRDDKAASKGIRGYYGYALSYGGKWFGGWRRDSRGRDYVAEARHSAEEQSPRLQGVELVNCPYDELNIPKDSIIYCDPPYAYSTGYHKDFDHDKFWEWCREKSKNNRVYISEYAAPDDFNCIWAKSVVLAMEPNSIGASATERLFSLEDLPLFNMLKDNRK